MFIAKLLGLSYLVVGLGMLLSGDYYKKAFQSMLKEAGMMYLGGLMALIIGFLIVNAHNVWEGWPMLVTILGWLALLKGFLLLVFPKGMMEWSAGMLKKNMNMMSIFVLALGAVFAYFGFLA